MWWKRKWNESESRSVMSNSLWPHGLYSPGNSPGQNTGLGSLSLLQGIFPTQGSNPGLPHCRWVLYRLSHMGSPRILKWVAIPSRGDLPDPGIKPGSPALQEDSLPTELSGKRKPSLLKTINSYLVLILIYLQLYVRKSIKSLLKEKSIDLMKGTQCR